MTSNVRSGLPRNDNKAAGTVPGNAPACPPEEHGDNGQVRLWHLVRRLSLATLFPDRRQTLPLSAPRLPAGGADSQAGSASARSVTARIT